MDTTNDHVVVKERADGLWDWHRIDSDNGEELSSSNQGYETKARAAEAAVALNPDAEWRGFVEE